MCIDCLRDDPEPGREYRVIKADIALAVGGHQFP
jgi:hypothetical protein